MIGLILFNSRNCAVIGGRNSKIRLRNLKKEKGNDSFEK